VQLLSQAEQDQWHRFPEAISQEELNRFFGLSPAEQQALDAVRGDSNRLGFALQLGCFPEHRLQSPHVVIQYVAQQVAVSPALLACYGTAPAHSNTTNDKSNPSQPLIRPAKDTYVDDFGKSSKRVRHFASRFLSTLGVSLARKIRAGSKPCSGCVRSMPVCVASCRRRRRLAFSQQPDDLTWCHPRG
jgi:hypothetical protein